MQNLTLLTLLPSEQPKLHRVLAVLSAIGLICLWESEFLKKKKLSLKLSMIPLTLEMDLAKLLDKEHKELMDLALSGAV